MKHQKRVKGWAAVAAGFLAGAGAAWAGPALAAPEAEAAPVYRIVTATGQNRAEARCPDSYTVTGGGHQGGASQGITNSYPSSDGAGWVATETGPQVRMKAIAVCVSQTP